MNVLTTGIAITENEKAECLAIRYRVFVEEQKIFRESDIDKLDRRSIYLYAKVDNKIIGTVRLTKLKEGLWLGSRLAVEKKYRKGAGILLIKLAENFVSKNGGGILRAFVQKRKEKLFNRLGWKTLREVRYHGLPHFLMEVNCVQFKFPVP